MHDVSGRSNFPTIVGKAALTSPATISPFWGEGGNVVGIGLGFHVCVISFQLPEIEAIRYMINLQHSAR